MEPTMIDLATDGLMMWYLGFCGIAILSLMISAIVWVIDLAKCRRFWDQWTGEELQDADNRAD